MIKTLSSNAINIYIFPDVNSTSVRTYMEASFMFRLTPLCAKDDDRAPVRRAIWKPTPKIFGVTYIKCSLALEPLSARSAIRKRAMLLCAYDVIFLSVRLDPALYVVHGHFSNRVMAASEK